MPSLEYRLLDEKELADGLAALPDWSVSGSHVEKTFAFKTYKDGLVFATAVGHLADRLDHHPDMIVSYGKVRIKLSTHAVKGLSPFDLELGRRIEALLA